MFSNEFLGFDLSDLPDFSHYDGNFNFDGLDWNAAGPSQPYMGVDIQGSINSYPDYLTPSTAPTSLYPDCGAFPDEGYNSLFPQGSTTALFSPQQVAATLPPFPAHSPVPVLPCGETYGESIAPGQYPYAQPQAIPDLDGLGLDFGEAGRPTLPAIHPSPSHVPSCGGFSGHYSAADPFNLSAPPPDPTPGATTPETIPPAPVASPSGPRRAGRAAREERRHNPVKSAKKKAKPAIEDWNPTLVRFRDKFDTLCSVQDGQPSGGLLPETALAEILKFMEEDLKHSPLQDKKSGAGTRPARSAEIYLRGLLTAIRPVEPIRRSVLGVEFIEDDTTAKLLSRTIEELEGRLEAVNQRPTLRPALGGPRPGKKAAGEEEGWRVKRGEAEKARRDRQRDQFERISRLFRAGPGRVRDKKDVLGLAVLFLLYGPDIFPQGFVRVRPSAPDS